MKTKLPLNGEAPSSKSLLNVFQRAASRIGMRRQRAETPQGVKQPVEKIFTDPGKPQVKSFAVPSKKAAQEVEQEIEAILAVSDKPPVKPFAASGNPAGRRDWANGAAKGIQAVGAILRSAPFDRTATCLLLDAASGKTELSRADLVDADAELVARGFGVEREVVVAREPKHDRVKVTLSLAAFSDLTTSEKGSYMKAGVKLTEGDAGSGKQRGSTSGAPMKLRPSTRLGDTPTDVARSLDLEFPPQPREGPTAKQYMAWTSAQVGELAAKTADPRTGSEARQHLWDAFASYSPSSYRYWGNTNPHARQKFYEKFQESIKNCAAFGTAETPNDPAPPATLGDMSARDFLTLPQTAVKSLMLLILIKNNGRNARAELKRAYQAASPAEKLALFGNFEQGLRAYMEEFI